MKPVVRAAVGKQSSREEEMLYTVWKDEENRCSSLLSSKEPVKLELMAGALEKTMVMSVENDGIPRYSAAGNEKEIEIKERWFFTAQQQRSGRMRINGVSTGEYNGRVSSMTVFPTTQQ
jgi:hypothetical protein